MWEFECDGSCGRYRCSTRIAHIDSAEELVALAKLHNEWKKCT